MNGHPQKLAVLIDADNASAAKIELVLEEIAKHGMALIKRAYGDWTNNNLQPWKKQLLTQSIQPIQQFAYTHGKNATDAAMIIDAMDLLYSNQFDGFCLVSSDSDFTRLAGRLREGGLTVYGLGEQKTPKPFAAACDRFVYVESLPLVDADVTQHMPIDSHSGNSPQSAQPVDPQQDDPPQLDEFTRVDSHSTTEADQLPEMTWLEQMLMRAISNAIGPDGWIGLDTLGGMLTPEFRNRLKGHGKLHKFIDNNPRFETERRDIGGGNLTLCVRIIKR